jgi:hypothetical protein
MDFYISLVVGITHAIVYNPVDKAIYNSIINNTKLFTRDNWRNPFIGATNGIYTRIISGGLYFYLIDYTKQMNVYQSAFIVSMTTSLIINPFNVVKYKSYINNTATYDTLIKTYGTTGLKFCKIGLEALVLRDFVFSKRII